MEKFKCTDCSTKFVELNAVFKHMRNVHGYKDNNQHMHCVVISNRCANSFKTFSGLRKHANTCVKGIKFDEVGRFEIYKFSYIYIILFMELLYKIAERGNWS